MRTAVEIQNTFNLAMFDGEETGLYYYGARYYNPRISLWYGVDPLAEKYPGVSPYAYCINNPIKYIDPDGKDVILVIWTTGTGSNGVGHAGIAVSNYEKVKTARIDSDGNAVLDNDGNQVYDISYEKDGTYTLYENWPENGVNFDLKGAVTSVEADRPITTINSEGGFTDGSTVSPYEGVAPDGVLKLPTSYEQDMAVKGRLEKANEKKTNYNGAWYNCSSFASDGLKQYLVKRLVEKVC